jgi:hypothetical protein
MADQMRILVSAISPPMSKAPTPPRESSANTYASTLLQVRSEEYNALIANTQSISGLSISIEFHSIVLRATADNGEIVRRTFPACTKALKFIRRCSTWGDHITATQFISLVDSSYHHDEPSLSTPELISKLRAIVNAGQN